jgi:hypothetical protein
MIRRIPLLDATTGQQLQLAGETTDIVPNDRTIYIDQDGNTYDPAQRNIRLEELPQGGVMELPRTTWWADVHDAFEPNGEVIPIGTPPQPLRVAPSVPLRLQPVTTWCFPAALFETPLDAERAS